MLGDVATRWRVSWLQGALMVIALLCLGSSAGCDSLKPPRDEAAIRERAMRTRMLGDRSWPILKLNATSWWPGDYWDNDDEEDR